MQTPEDIATWKAACDAVAKDDPESYRILVSEHGYIRRLGEYSEASLEHQRLMRIVYLQAQGLDRIEELQAERQRKFDLVRHRGALAREEMRKYEQRQKVIAEQRRQQREMEQQQKQQQRLPAVAKSASGGGGGGGGGGLQPKLDVQPIGKSMYKSGEFITNPDTGTVYTIIREMASGSFGSAYLARTEPRTRFIIKVSTQRDKETLEMLTRRAEREYAISEALLSTDRLYNEEDDDDDVELTEETSDKAEPESNVCNKNASCARNIFYGKANTKMGMKTAVFLVFRFEPSFEMNDYLGLMHDEFDKIKKERDSRAKLAMHQVWSYRLLIVLESFMKAVAALHAYDVIHRDIKPENALVLRNRKDLENPLRAKKVKMIDFGNSCISRQSARKLLTLSKQRIDDTSCSIEYDEPNGFAFYSTTPGFRDPETGLGGVNTLGTLFEQPDEDDKAGQRKFMERMKAYDIFSCGCVLQLAFDEAQYYVENWTELPDYHYYARSTERFPVLKTQKVNEDSPVLTLIEEMLGPRENRRSAVEYAEQLRIIRHYIKRDGLQ